MENLNDKCTRNQRLGKRTLLEKLDTVIFYTALLAVSAFVGIIISNMIF